MESEAPQIHDTHEGEKVQGSLRYSLMRIVGVLVATYSKVSKRIEKFFYPPMEGGPMNTVSPLPWF